MRWEALNVGPSGGYAKSLGRCILEQRQRFHPVQVACAHVSIPFVEEDTVTLFALIWIDIWQGGEGLGPA